MADNSGLFAERPMLMQTLAAGWPNDPKVIAACLTAAQRHRPRTGINHEVAKRYLLHFSQTNPDLDAKVAALIRADKYFFSPSFGTVYKRGLYGPEVRAALDFRLDQISDHAQNDIAHLAVMSGSDHAKQQLFAMLATDDDWAFWPVYGLLQGWGMQDADVAAALLLAAGRPAERAQYFAHHLPSIILDKAACRAKLLKKSFCEVVECILDRLDSLEWGLRCAAKMIDRRFSYTGETIRGSSIAMIRVDAALLSRSTAR